MRCVVLSLLCLGAWAYAQAGSMPEGSAPAKRAPSEHVQSVLSDAYRAFNEKEYEKAYYLFLQVEYRILEDPKAIYYMGRSAYESGHFRDAIIAYERLLALDPNNLDAILELARTYYKLDNLTDAKRLFEIALKRKLPPLVEKRVRYALERIENRQKKDFLYARVSVGVGYDSNVFNRPQYTDLILPGDILITNTVTGDSDLYHQDSLELDHYYDIGERGGFVLENRLYTYFQTMREYSSKNLFYINYMPSILYRDGKNLYRFGGGVDYTLYGSDPYMQNWFLRGSFRHSSSYTSYWELTATYQRKVSRSDTYPQRDADYGMLTYLWHSMPTDRWSIEPAMALIRERKIHSRMTDIDRDAYVFRLWSAYDFDAKYSVEGALNYKIIEYKEKDFFFLQNRHDDYIHGRVTLSRKFAHRLKVEFSAGWIDSRSDLPIYSYRKHYFNLDLVKEF